jgi:type I restriction enzyme S subunit
LEKVKQGYKMTELGEIPEEWEVKRFGEIFSFMKSGLSRNLKDDDIGIPCIRSTNIVDEKINTTDLKYWFLEDDKGANINDYLLDDGDILVNFINSIAQIGKTCIYNNIGRKSIYTTNIFRIKVNGDLVNNKFFYYFTQTAKYNNEISLITKPAVNQASFTSVDFKNIKMAIATKKEQQKISAILSSVDEQIENTDNLIEKTKELKKGLMQRLLTKGIGHDRFKDTEIGRIPEEWEVKRLSDITQIIMGQSPDSSSYNEEGEGIPFFQGKTEFGSINPEVKKWCSKPTKIAEPLDILISVRAPVGDVNINNVHSCIGRGLGTIRQTNISYFKYIYYVLQIYQNEFKKSSQGSTFEAINSSDLKGLKIPAPEIEEQKQIASILSFVDEQIEQYKAKKEKLQELKKGLMQELLTGKIRV